MFLRGRVFDTIVNESLRVLDLAASTRPLHNPLEPEAIADTRHIIEHAFLPNVRRGMASMPRRHFSTDHIAVLPLSSREAADGIIMHPSMLQLTPSCIASLTRALQAKHETPEMPKHLTTASAIGNMVLGNLRSNPDIARRKLYQLGKTHAYGQEQDGITVTTTPYILLAADKIKDQPKGTAASVLTHEALHASDIMRDLTPESSQSAGPEYRAYMELRGHNLATRVMSIAGAARVNGYQSIVETLRLRYNTDPATPFATPPALIEGLSALGIVRR